MKTVILAGGFGTRLSEYTDDIPKPMVPIGGMPMLVHIMGIYAHYNYKDFVLALGYKADRVKSYFLNYYTLHSDFTIDMGTGVRWTNNGTTQHTATDTSMGALFDSGNLAPGGTYLYFFVAAGKYAYYDSLHTTLTGNIKVPVLAQPHGIACDLVFQGGMQGFGKGVNVKVMHYTQAWRQVLGVELKLAFVAPAIGEHANDVVRPDDVCANALLVDLQVFHVRRQRAPQVLGG